MKLKVKSVKFVSYQRQLEGYMGDAYDAALYQQGIDIMGESVLLCPVEFGRLRNSGYVGPPRNHVVELGYGTSYSGAVHWNTHAQHAPPTQALFLSDPINAARSTWEPDMARKINNAFDKRLKWGGGNFPPNPGE